MKGANLDCADIDIRWSKVTLTLATHHEGGLTEKDFTPAKKFGGCQFVERSSGFVAGIVGADDGTLVCGRRPIQRP
jgi:hypothetical protein